MTVDLSLFDLQLAMHSLVKGLSFSWEGSFVGSKRKKI